MLGSSRESLAACSAALDARRQAPGFEELSAQVFAVAALLDDNAQLRSTLADSGQPASVRESLIRDILANQVSAVTLDVVADVVDHRWSDDVDLVIALEQLAAQAAFTVAEGNGTLDATEEEIFRFGRAIDASAELQMALGDPARSAQTKAAIVRDLLSDRATAATREVLESTVGRLHGQRLDAAIDTLCELAARQRERVVAEVRVAAPLTEEQSRRLAAALSSLKGRTVRLNVAVDPAVLGGVMVTIGDEVIEESIDGRANARVVSQRFPDDFASKFDGQFPYLPGERAHRLGSIGSHLCFRRSGDLGGCLSCLVLGFLHHRRAVGLGLCPDGRRFLTCRSKLPLVLLEYTAGFRLSFLSTLQATLDGVCTLVECRFDLGQREFAESTEDDQERDQADD